MIRFTVPGNPKALKRHRMCKRGKKFGSYDPSKSDKADFLALAKEAAPNKPLDGPISLCITCFFPRPKSHYRTGKYAHLLKDDSSLWHTKTPDIDNVIKFICDALNGIFWRDDSIICFVQAKKYYDDRPRVEVQVMQL